MNKLLCGYSMEELYIDQAINLKWPISTFYTPHGIKLKDANYCKRICRGNENKFKLQDEILKDPHLHVMIKNNLLYNLFNR
jgi:hypothetical protein